MMKNFEDFQLLAGHGVEESGIPKKVTPDFPFNDHAVAFLSDLSSELLAYRESKLYPDVVSFAFFCRKASLKIQAATFLSDRILIGRGNVLHIAPGNVPVNFAYSFVAGLLSGNGNIVKVSSREFRQVDIILEKINRLFEREEYQDLAEQNAFVKFGHESPAGERFSKYADARVIWGGDDTVRKIKALGSRPRCVDICFSDRYSIALINPDAIVNLEAKELQKVAENFYNDTYLFDQNACSAPHIVFWLKTDSLKEGKSKFWKALDNVVKQKYEFQPIMGVDKLNDFYLQATHMDITLSEKTDNRLWVVEADHLTEDFEEYRSKCGYFLETAVDGLDDLIPHIKRKYQTLVYHGFLADEMREWVKKSRLIGLDRICPFGESTRFSLIWDGYNLIDMLSRTQIVE